MAWKATNHQTRKAVRKISKVSNDALPKDENRAKEKPGAQRAEVKKININNLTGDAWLVEYDSGGKDWVALSTPDGFDALPAGEVDNGFLYPSEPIIVDVLQDSTLKADRIISTRNTTLDKDTEPGTKKVYAGDSVITLTEEKALIEHQDSYIEVTEDGIKISSDDTVIEGAPEFDPLVVYPVGALYLSAVNVNPATLFGGTWSQIKDKFLLSAGDTYENGSTGGTADNTLSEQHLPSHKHDVSITSSGAGTSGSSSPSTDSQGAHTHDVKLTTNRGATGTATAVWSAENSTSDLIVKSGGAHTHTVASHTHSTPDHTHTISESDVGSGTAINNLPPYLTVYVWQRTA